MNSYCEALEGTPHGKGGVPNEILRTPRLYVTHRIGKVHFPQLSDLPASFNSIHQLTDAILIVIIGPFAASLPIKVHRINLLEFHLT